LRILSQDDIKNTIDSQFAMTAHVHS
jgi:hypothetical protein